MGLPISDETILPVVTIKYSPPFFAPRLFIVDSYWHCSVVLTFQQTLFVPTSDELGYGKTRLLEFLEDDLFQLLSKLEITTLPLLITQMMNARKEARL